MASYYDILRLKPNATSAEIQAACDALYNQRRQSVTHHDPKVVAQANQDLQTLETIRTTLMNPAKRVSYDAGLSLGGIWGLADPEASVHAPAIQNTPPTPTQQPAPAVQRVDAWICSKCKHPNAVGMQFCAKCGSQIGQACPRCGKSVAIADPFCAHCGAEIDTARRQQIEQRLRDLRVQLQQERQAMEPLERLSKKKWSKGPGLLGGGLEGKLWRSASYFKRTGIGCLWFFACAGMVFLAFIVTSFFSKITPTPSGGYSEELPIGILIVSICVGIAIVIVAEGFTTAKLVRDQAKKQLEPYRERVAAIESWIQQIRRGSLK